MGNQQIIELNGQRYDARTGALINTPKQPTKAKARAVTPKAKTSGGSMDGFARPSRGIKQHAAPRTPEKSKTLMRKAVQKPAAKAAPVAENPRRAHVVPSRSASKTSRHGGGVPRSGMISHFGAAAQTARATATAQTTHAKQATHPRTTTSRPKQHPAITKGLAAATSHEQPRVKKPRLHARVAKKLHISPRLASSGAFALAFLVIGGFFTYQNIPGMTMRLASSRSGVQGSLPGYQPSGFRIEGGIAYKKGQITINYKSNSDQRNFKISQDNSDWDSQGLLTNYVTNTQNTYQTVQDKGKTVYIYNDSNATWVDGGVWYRIEGDSSLNSDQLLRLAASL